MFFYLIQKYINVELFIHFMLNKYLSRIELKFDDENGYIFYNHFISFDSISISDLIYLIVY